MINTPTPLAERDGFVHQGLFYDSDEEYRTAVGSFVRAGLEAGEPVLVAVPGEKVELLREVLGGHADRVTFLDMTELGRNPARITPTVRGFVDARADQRVRFVGEPIWPGRTAAEVREATRHEALINAAFADTQATILCPYDTARLAEHVLVDAEQTHPEMVERGAQRASTVYSGSTLPSDCDQPLSAPPEDAVTFTFSQSGDLARIRSIVTDHATRAGLGVDRVSELVLAVGEVSGNTLRHTDGGGVLNVWQAGDRLVCQVQDRGLVTDPLAGRRRPTHRAGDSRGLWLVNQLCELVQLRTHETGTTVRLHAQLG